MLDLKLQSKLNIINNRDVYFNRFHDENTVNDWALVMGIEEKTFYKFNKKIQGVFGNILKCADRVIIRGKIQYIHDETEYFQPYIGNILFYAQDTQTCSSHGFGEEVLDYIIGYDENGDKVGIYYDDIQSVCILHPNNVDEYGCDEYEGHFLEDDQDMIGILSQKNIVEKEYDHNIYYQLI